MQDVKKVYIIKTDLKGNYTYVNSHFIQTFGFMNANFIGKNSLDSVYFEDAHLVVHAVNNLIKGKTKIEQIEMRKPYIFNDFIWTYWEFSIEYDADNQPIGIICIGNDSTK